MDKFLVKREQANAKQQPANGAKRAKTEAGCPDPVVVDLCGEAEAEGEEEEEEEAGGSAAQAPRATAAQIDMPLSERGPRTKAEMRRRGMRCPTFAAAAEVWRAAADQAALLRMNWVELLNQFGKTYGVVLRFGEGEVVLGCGYGPKSRELKLLGKEKPLRKGQWRVVEYHPPHASHATRTQVLGPKGSKYVQVALKDEGCGECGGDEVYQLQLQEEGSGSSARRKRLKIRFYSHCRCDGGDEEVDSSIFYADPARL